MKRKLFFLIYVVLLVLTAIAYVYYIDYKNKRQLQDSISCYSQIQYDYVSDKKTVVIQAGIFFFLSNGHGVISYSGTLTDQDDVYTLRRDAEVNYKVKNDNSFFIVTKKLSIAPFDTLPTALAKKYLYGYLREEKGWTNMSIQRNGENGYLISTNPLPQLLCHFAK
ncbi:MULTISPECIES: hypothetical protein [Serratia]|uniref:Uncharacterized protein n=1 Tax=Serratia quinivorans TaxID=137545 RepID=A0A379YL68_9GAMM|nr:MULTISPECIES: hypothetical protein [Serratia]RYM61639.1 hypothetical protein BSR03_10920 [Serratia proteamaculans]CAI1770065.1 Uncharacterised protein [Serratia quinivorans]CAI1796882.1 Uncharacterised protein [Serratia quinivorans]SUI46701.1 Uncharacterised protein [Serratia quinivorans]